MKAVYFDNAATTPVRTEVIKSIQTALENCFGNPSSTHSFGRTAKTAVEQARKTIAATLGAHPSEIIFTSGGTEADNMVLKCAVRDLGVKHIVTTTMEHHAVLHTVDELVAFNGVTPHYVAVDANGNPDLLDLEKILSGLNEKVLVSLMHINNEIGNMIDLQKVGEICKTHNAYFHSDTVQTVGHFPFDLKNTPVHFITGAGHKFHGPKGVGILYIHESIKIKPFVHGGAQERNMRAGTENLYGIVGFAKALEIATEQFEKDSAYINGLKQYMMEQLEQHIAGVTFNGDPIGSSLYAVLSVNFPASSKSEMLLFNLDIHHICASGGSACSSGANAGSHVIRAINNNPDITTVRFSFSKHNTKNEIDVVVARLKEMI